MKRSVKVIPEKIRELARKIGCPLSTRTLDNEFAWNGKTIATYSMDKITPRPLRDIIHDIAHHLCATEDRKNIPEFGLGTAVDDGVCAAACIINTAMDEEVLASLLGILIERQLGYEWWHTWRDHNWDMEVELPLDAQYDSVFSAPGVKNSIKELIDMNLISADLTVHILEGIA